MYKNFNLTESERKEILNRLKENGYGQPINEQNAPVNKPVAPQQTTGGNVPPRSKALRPRPNMELVQKINTLKEFVNVFNNNVETYVSKAHVAEWGIMVNSRATKTYRENGGTNPRSFEVLFLKVRGGTFTLNSVIFQFSGAGNGSVRPVGENTTIVSDLLESKDFNEFYQKLNKYTPEVWARMQTTAETTDLQLNILKQELTTSTLLHYILDYFDDVQKDMEVFETVYPKFRETLWNVYEYEKYTALNKIRKEAEDAEDYTLRKQKNQSYQISLDYYKKRDPELKKILGMSPDQDKYTPAQGQQPAPQQAVKKPLNEGQEILKDVFSKMMGLNEQQTSDLTDYEKSGQYETDRFNKIFGTQFGNEPAQTKQTGEPIVPYEKTQPSAPTSSISSEDLAKSIAGIAKAQKGSNFLNYIRQWGHTSQESWDACMKGGYYPYTSPELRKQAETGGYFPFPNMASKKAHDMKNGGGQKVMRRPVPPPNRRPVPPPPNGRPVPPSRGPVRPIR